MGVTQNRVFFVYKECDEILTKATNTKTKPYWSQEGENKMLRTKIILSGLCKTHQNAL